MLCGDWMAGLRILMISNHFYPSIGGLENQAQRLANELANKGVEVEVITPRYDNLLKEELLGKIKVTRFPIIRNPHTRGDFLSKIFYCLSLWYVIWKKRKFIDVIHVHQALHAAAFSVIVAKVLQKKIIIKDAGSGNNGNMWYLNNVFSEGKILISIIRNADAIISLSSETTEELLVNEFDIERIIEIPNGVQIDKFSGKNRNAAKWRVRDSNISFVAISVGRIVIKEKRIDILLNAWAKLVAKRKDAILLIVGDGPDLPKLSYLVKELDIERQVRLFGFRDDIIDLLRQSDCFILPSVSEGMSNSLLEAMCSGVCCLASRVSGNEGLIDDGETGLLFDLNESDLLEKINIIIGDHVFREKMGQKSRQKVKDKYSFDVITEKYIELYSKLLKFKGTSRDFRSCGLV